jgi:hypothetical protein
MNKFKKIFLPVLFINLTSYLILHTPSVLAQSAFGISAIPPRLEINVKPGEVVTKEIKVRNESPVNKIFSTTIKDFIVTDDQGTPLQLPDTANPSRWAASTWIQVSPANFRIKPGETKSLMLTVLTPKDALPGGHYAMVLHSPENQIAISGSGSEIQTNVGTLAYITVAGPITQKAQIIDFSAPRFSEYGPINFQTIVKNLSDIHITPVGAVVVKNSLGLKTAELDLTSTNIFPLTTRTLTNTLNRKLLLGRYRAQINAAYGTAGGLLTATLFFWVIPWRLIILLIIMVIIIGTLSSLFTRRPPKPQDSQIDQLEKELADLKKKYQDKQ